MLFFDAFLILFIGSAVAFDIKERRIPNWLVFAATLTGFLLHLTGGIPQLLDSFLGFGLGIGLLFIPFALGLLGAGDVKLVGAVGAVLGAAWIPRVLFYSVLAGSLLAALSIATKGMNWTVLKDTWLDMKLFVTSRGIVLPETLDERGAKGASTIPYGVAIGLGTLLAFYGDHHGHWAGF